MKRTAIEPERDTFPKLSSSSCAIHNVFNCSTFFGTARCERKEGRFAYPATNGFSIVLRGKKMRQDDKAVLLELVHRRRGFYAGEVEFAPITFCGSRGWSDSKDSKNTAAASVPDRCGRGTRPRIR